MLCACPALIAEPLQRCVLWSTWAATKKRAKYFGYFSSSVKSLRSMITPSFCLESEMSQSVALKAVNVAGLINSTAVLNSSRFLWVWFTWSCDSFVCHSNLRNNTVRAFQPISNFVLLCIKLPVQVTGSFLCEKRHSGITHLSGMSLVLLKFVLKALCEKKGYEKLWAVRKHLVLFFVLFSPFLW